MTVSSAARRERSVLEPGNLFCPAESSPVSPQGCQMMTADEATFGAVLEDRTSILPANKDTIAEAELTPPSTGYWCMHKKSNISISLQAEAV